MRLPKAVVIAICLSGFLLPGTQAQASTSAPVSASPAASSCSSHMLRIPFTGHFTQARRAGHAVTATVTLRSSTKVALTRVFFDYELDPPTSHRRPTPTMAWRLDHRKWRALPLPNWTPASSKTDAFWESNDVRIGPIAPHSKHRLQMRITFHKRDHPGLYPGQAGFGSPACGHGRMLIGFGEINFAYEP